MYEPNKPSFRTNPPLQRGTGAHLDINPHSMFKKQLVNIPEKDSDFTDLQFWRPFQALVVMNDQSIGDSGLEVMPGFHLFAEQYFKLGGPGDGINVTRMSYNAFFQDKTAEILNYFTYVKRIPINWDHSKLPPLPTDEEVKNMSREDITKCIKMLHEELEESMKDTECLKEGDYVIWDMRITHKNGESNDTDKVRQAFYNALIPALPVNETYVTKDQLQKRMEGMHPPNFPKLLDSIEKPGYTPYQLSEFGKLLYGINNWEQNTNLSKIIPPQPFTLSPNEIAFFKRYGYISIPDCVSKSSTQELAQEIDSFLNSKGINTKDYKQNERKVWKKVMGTFGGMLEVYLAKGQEKIRESAGPYWATRQLLKETWAKNEEGFKHPFGNFDPSKLWLYIDRYNYRLPTEISNYFKPNK